MRFSPVKLSPQPSFAASWQPQLSNKSDLRRPHSTSEKKLTAPKLASLISCVFDRKHCVRSTLSEQEWVVSETSLGLTGHGLPANKCEASGRCAQASSLSIGARYEALSVVAARYRSTGRAEKWHILNALCRRLAGMRCSAAATRWRMGRICWGARRIGLSFAYVELSG